MRKILLYLFLLAAVVSMSSCRRAVEKARQNIRVEAIEKVERRGMTALDVTLRVMNNTGYKLAMEKAQIELYYGSSRVGEVLLREGVLVDRRTTESVPTRWQIKISDPLAMFVLIKKIEAGEIDDVSVSYAVEGRGGPAPVKISRERVPLSEILRTFGLTMQDVKNYLTE